MARQTKRAQEEELTFEAALARLEELVESLDSEELALEDLVRRYGEGMNLLKHCQGQLENARQRIETMPTLGLEQDSRLAVISLSDQSVSPTNTGFGSVISPQPRLAAAFSLVSGTVIPRTNASVKALFTSGCPNCVRSA